VRAAVRGSRGGKFAIRSDKRPVSGGGGGPTNNLSQSQVAGKGGGTKDFNRASLEKPSGGGGGGFLRDPTCFGAGGLSLKTRGGGIKKSIRRKDRIRGLCGEV